MPTTEEPVTPGHGAEYGKNTPGLFTAYNPRDLPTTIPTEAEVKARKAGADDTANGSKQPQDTRIAQITGESGIQWDPVSKLFEIVIGGVIVGAVATWNAASDLYHHVMKSEKKNKDNLPKDKDGRPVPDSEHPHTQLGQREGRKGSYRKTREWGKDGKLEKDTDWTDHGRPKDHPNPHQHRWLPNSTGGTPQRGPAEPLK